MLVLKVKYFFCYFCKQKKLDIIYFKFDLKKKMNVIEIISLNFENSVTLQNLYIFSKKLNSKINIIQFLLLTN